MCLLSFCRLGDFGGFVQTVEDLQKQLQREDLTSEEYKDVQAKFQVRTMVACIKNILSQSSWESHLSAVAKFMARTFMCCHKVHGKAILGIEPTQSRQNYIRLAVK